jgi:hypothetical protein
LLLQGFFAMSYRKIAETIAKNIVTIGKGKWLFVQ